LGIKEIMKSEKGFAKKFIGYFAWLLSCLYSYKMHRRVLQLADHFYSFWVSREFKNFGKDSIVQRLHVLEVPAH